ncbi:bacteriophage abortive infection AbiH family protein [Sphingobacterium psychroaquaticum]|uniref:Bacteriophage abortive infection AbiH n=1 Tax=Sphingobacterium psychroaquaticum TaxID=561061 RepID=A0A1X7IMP7_9SPHI|nr:bacteriophage abortive infection AbiH family protein [Sphingobacterium psychroaquaticum]SMG15983.1 Bacteriophage abortive infection AbiH [Sphingobacterium psychroaquaticum]
MKLYILGNGFDLHHKLKTRYADFHEFLHVHNQDIEFDLERYFNFQVDSNYLWKCFEDDLAHYNYQEFFETYNNIDIMSESFKPSECYGLEDEISERTESFVDQIRSNFTDWLLSIEYPKPEDLPRSILLNLDKRALFMNFNYTDTLSELYGVSRDRIFYIHNNANEQYGDLIFGHGQEEEDDPEEPELDENGDSNRTMFTDSQRASRTPFNLLKKDTESIINDNTQFFSSLDQVSEVIVLGHSYGEVDLPYFKEVKNNIKNLKWKMAYYSQDDFVSCQTAIKICGISKDQIEMIKITDLINQ